MMMLTLSLSRINRLGWNGSLSMRESHGAGRSSMEEPRGPGCKVKPQSGDGKMNLAACEMHPQSWILCLWIENAGFAACLKCACILLTIYMPCRDVHVYQCNTAGSSLVWVPMSWMLIYWRKIHKFVQHSWQLHSTHYVKFVSTYIQKIVSTCQWAW